ncbi:hypothetical protein BaRGS_00001080 [Batillaria attramentaria]|uniref:Uncharacterized protein n=1 Tax=Batillaria attramentaria TaxID=370345 RepID=A0ABD0M5X8_9CAEN
MRKARQTLNVAPLAPEDWITANGSQRQFVWVQSSVNVVTWGLRHCWSFSMLTLASFCASSQSGTGILLPPSPLHRAKFTKA